MIRHQHNMLTKNDFTAADWNTLRDTQYLVGYAMVLAGSSGLGTIKELAALSQGIIERQSSSVPLIRDLSAVGEMQAAQASLKQSLGPQQGNLSADTMRQLALDRVRNCLAILGPNASREETDAYRRTLYDIADRVAKAAREGGFLGFGGPQISEGERSFLNQLRDALQLEEVKTA
jgi:hypothetical protein